MLLELLFNVIIKLLQDIQLIGDVVELLIDVLSKTNWTSSLLFALITILPSDRFPVI